MSPDFTMDVTDPRTGIAVVRVAGRLEARAAQELRRRCSDLRDSGRTRILINLSGISFVASSGIGTLLALTEESKEAGGSVQLVSLSHSVAAVVDLLNLTEFLAIFDSESKALETLGV
jgi:anti-anti-sigma factor